MTRVFNDLGSNLRNVSTTFAVGLSGGYKVNSKNTRTFFVEKREQNPSFTDTYVNAILFKHRCPWILIFFTAT